MKTSRLLFVLAAAAGFTLTAGAENITTLRTADAWKAMPWNKAKGEVIPSANVPAEGKIEGLDESIQFKIDYSGKGFEHWGAEPRKKQVKPIKGAMGWVSTDLEGYFWLICCTDGQGRVTYKDGDKEKRMEWGIDLAEDWYLWEWEKPEEWPAKIRFAGFKGHNWGNDKVPAAVSMFVYDLQVVPADPAAK